MGLFSVLGSAKEKELIPHSWLVPSCNVHNGKFAPIAGISDKNSINPMHIQQIQSFSYDKNVTLCTQKKNLLKKGSILGPFWPISSIKRHFCTVILDKKGPFQNYNFTNVFLVTLCPPKKSFERKVIFQLSKHEKCNILGLFCR